MSEFNLGGTRASLIEALGKMIQHRSPIHKIIMTPECFASLMVDCAVTEQNEHEVLMHEGCRKTFLNIPVELRSDMPPDYNFCVMSGEVET